MKRTYTALVSTRLKLLIILTLLAMFLAKYTRIEAMIYNSKVHLYTSRDYPLCNLTDLYAEVVAEAQEVFSNSRKNIEKVRSIIAEAENTANPRKSYIKAITSLVTMMNKYIEEIDNKSVI